MVSGTAFDTSKHLRRSDILSYPWGMMLLIRWTKTIQFRERVLQIPLPRLGHHVLCPVAAVFRAFELTPNARPDGPALLVSDFPKQIPLSTKVFMVRLQQCLVSAGVQPSNYAGHSFRRGGAMWAYKAGVEPETIRQLGDWRSEAYKEYVKPDTSCLFHAVTLMQQQMT